MSVEETATDLAEILSRLEALPANVLGYSLGARVALVLARLRRIRVGGLHGVYLTKGYSPNVRSIWCQMTMLR